MQRSLIKFPRVEWKLSCYRYDKSSKTCEIEYGTESQTITPTINNFRIKYNFERSEVLINVIFSHEIPLTSSREDVLHRLYNPTVDKTIAEIKEKIIRVVNDKSKEDCTINIELNMDWVIKYKVKINEKNKIKAILDAIDSIAPFSGKIQNDIDYLTKHEPRFTADFIQSYADEDPDYAIEIATQCKLSNALFDLGQYYADHSKYNLAFSCFKLYAKDRKHGSDESDEAFKDAKYIMGIIMLIEYMEHRQRRYSNEILHKALKYFLDSGHKPMADKVYEQCFHGFGLFPACISEATSSSSATVFNHK